MIGSEKPGAKYGISKGINNWKVSSIMELKNESQTLFIPLYGKALMSKQNLFLNDPKAQEIIESVDFNFEELKQSKWLSMYMAARARIFDEITSTFIEKNSDVTVIHLGCGLDSRCLRINGNSAQWYDIDYPNVIELRKKFYTENDKYRMIGKSVVDLGWLDEIGENNSSILIVAEGLTMYLSEKEIQQLLKGINERFGNVTILFDAYSKQAVKSSKIKNPVNQMSASVKWGMDTPEDFNKLNDNLEFVREFPIRYRESNLTGAAKFIFENLYCGRISESLYKIYEFNLKGEQ